VLRVISGIGFATLQALSLKTPSDHFILGCRDIQKGQQAITQLRNLGVESKIDVLQVDVTSDDSLVASAKEVYDRHGKLDGTCSVHKMEIFVLTG
jgi:NAD(P)-dependent dehydrogenase (short-subunit alcohol dehydrogenase family)